MPTLVLILLVIWLALMGLLAVWTLFFQGYIYTEPVDNIQWRAPAAGSAVTLFLIVMVFLDYRSPGDYGPLHSFDVAKVDEFNEFRVVTQEGNEEIYRPAGGKSWKGQRDYRLDGRIDGTTPPSTPLKVIVREKDADVVFEPELDARGKFKRGAGLPLYYYDKKSGRYMEEGRFNFASRFQTGKLIANLALNFAFLAVWFMALWLLLDYRGWQAFGLAIVFWTATILLVMPPVLSKTEEVSRQRTAMKSSLQAISPPGCA